MSELVGITLPNNLFEFFDRTYAPQRLTESSHDTVMGYRRALVEFSWFLASDPTFHNLDEDTVERLLIWMKRSGRSNATINKYSRYFLAVWNYAWKKRRVTKQHSTPARIEMRSFGVSTLRWPANFICQVSSKFTNSEICKMYTAPRLTHDNEVRWPVEKMPELRRELKAAGFPFRLHDEHVRSDGETWVVISFADGSTWWDWLPGCGVGDGQSEQAGTATNCSGPQKDPKWASLSTDG